MSVPYVTIGQPITHSEMDALDSAASAKLVNLHAGLPAVLWGGGFDRKFYFFNTIPTAPFANIAQAYIYWASVNPSTEKWFRKYDHTPFSNFASAATLVTVPGGDPRPVANSAYPCARVNSATLSPALGWPGPSLMPPQLLLGSLEAHKATLTVNLVTTQSFTVPAVTASVTVWVNDGLLVSVADALVIDGGAYVVSTRAGNQLSLVYGGGAAHGTCPTATSVNRGGSQVTETNCYYLFVDGDHIAEHPENWTPIDVIFGDGVGTTFTWPANWNKYSFIRFNNLQTSAVTLTFNLGTSQAIVVPAMGAVCVRAVPGSSLWGVGGSPYFFSHHAGDPLFLHRPQQDGKIIFASDAEGSGCPIFCPMEAARLLLNTARDSLVMDGTQFWNMGPEYCGTGATLYGSINDGAISNFTPIGDLMVHRGKLVVVDVTSETDLISQTHNYTVGALPDTEALPMNNGADAQAVSSVVVTRGGTGIPASGNWSVAAVGTGYTITFLSGGVLAPGDAVVVTFLCYRREPLFQIINYTGINNLAANFAGTGITVTVPSPSNPYGFRLSSSTKTYDVIGLSSNLFSPPTPGGKPGVTVAPGTPAEVWGYLSSTGFGSLTAPLFTHSTSTKTVNWTDLSTGNPISTTFNVLVLVESGGASLITMTPWNSLGDLKTAITGVGGDATLALDFLMTPAGPLAKLTQSLAPVAASGALPAKYDLDPTTHVASHVTSALFPLMSFESFGRNRYQWWKLWQSLQGVIGWPNLPSDLDRTYPRQQHAWLTHRIFPHDVTKEPFATSPVAYTTLEEPMVKNWYEAVPFVDFSGQDGQLIGPGDLRKDSLTKLLRFFYYYAFSTWTYHVSDSMMEISAFFNGDLINWVDPVTGLVTTKNLATGNKDRAGFYDALRGFDDLAVVDEYGRRALPIQAEHYNLVASIVNGVTGDFAAPAPTDAQNTMLTDLGTIGLGIFGYRPRTQYTGWLHSSGGAAAIEAFWTAQGVTIRTSADFVAYNKSGGSISFASVMAANNLYVTNQTTLATSETNPGTGVTTLLTDAGFLFGGYGTSLTNDYRWVTIADAQAVFAALKIPFVFQELAVPLRLVMADATLSHASVTGGALSGYGYPLARIAGWVNDATGEWVRDATDTTRDLDPDVVQPVIRADDSKVDICIQDATVTDFGGGLERNIWSGELVRQCQGLMGHQAYLYRRYGSAPVKFALYGKNYANFSPRNGGYPGDLLKYVPRVAVGGLDGTFQLVDGTSANEIAVTTTLENAVMIVWPAPIPC